MKGSRRLERARGAGLATAACLALWTLAASPVCGQARGDSLLAPGSEPGHATRALSFSDDITGSLSGRAASFVYDFNAFGWPNGWSPYGLSPQAPALIFEGIPFDDPVTGRPRYDLLPTALLSSGDLTQGRLGAPMAVIAELRPLAATPALTELHYQAGAHGLQRVTALHTQERRLTLFGETGMLGVVFGYGGGAAAGEFPGSRLRRLRQLLLRGRYSQAAWSLEALLLHNQRRLGAHGGVLPANIYNRLIAQVRDGGAERRNVRNDLSVTFRVRALAAMAFFTSHTLRYHNPARDTLSATIQRAGGRVRQDLRLGAHGLRLVVEAYAESISRSNIWPEGLSRTNLHVTLRDSMRWGPVAVTLEGGAHRLPHASFATGAGRAQQALGSAHIFVEASLAGAARPWIEELGWGSYAQAASAPAGGSVQGRAGMYFALGPLEVEPFGFIREERQPRDYFLEGQDSVVVRAASSPARINGVGADIGFRRRASRGLYAWVTPTAMDIQGAALGALPRFFAQGRLGARYALFTGDLEVDLSIRGRAWTQMRSRPLHAPTGLLVLPVGDTLYLGDEMLPASSALDVIVEATVRTADLFVAYENALSGTELLPGNQIVPSYPLPAGRLRFGVYWPIRN